jgi:hypothetical protein
MTGRGTLALRAILRSINLRAGDGLAERVLRSGDWMEDNWMVDLFLVARNPELESTLPYLVHLPLDGGILLKVRDTWPRSSRIYCHPYEAPWDSSLEIVEETPVILCRRRGAAIDLVLDRPKLARSQFIFTQARGRSAIFWQTQKAAQAANPGARVPKARALSGLTVLVDTRERYGYRFSARQVTTERATLAAGDYAVAAGDMIVATVERKTLENLTTSLSDGTMAFQLQRLAEAPLAAVVVEGDYPDVFRSQPSRGAWLADMLARLAVRYPDVPIVFAGSRKFAEEWTYRFLTSALEDYAEE